MRTLAIFAIGICAGIALDRVAGPTVDSVLSRSSAAVTAFQEAK